MRKHNGMRPQDIVILLKIIASSNKNWQLKDLAAELLISPSEVSESLNRSSVAGLVNHKKDKVHRSGLLEFLQYGIHYVFPQQPGAIVNGMPTAHSHPFMKEFIVSKEYYVWPDIHGKVRGAAIEPLYPNQTEAAKKDPLLYELLALVDVLRVGRAREIKVAVAQLSKIFQHEPSN